MVATIQIEKEQVCAYTDAPIPEYVIYTGGIAGISDRSDLKSDAEPIERGANKVELER
jgi:hypothetical protein